MISPAILACAPAGSSAPYHADAVHFDGGAYLTNAALVASVSPSFSRVCWFKTTTDNAEATFFACDPDDAVIPYFTLASGQVGSEFGPIPAGGPDNWEAVTTALFNDDNWHCLIETIDAGTGSPRKHKLYIDDMEITAYDALHDNGASAFDIAGNGQKVQVGFDDTDDNGFFVGDMADFRIFYGVSLLDMSGDISLATRRLFIDGSGKPVDPSVATASLGTAGTILFSGDAFSFGTNQGSGGTFITTGTLTNASTSPSD